MHKSKPDLTVVGYVLLSGIVHPYTDTASIFSLANRDDIDKRFHRSLAITPPARVRSFFMVQLQPRISDRAADFDSTAAAIRYIAGLTT